jgi:hypothetical protein
MSLITVDAQRWSLNQADQKVEHLWAEADAAALKVADHNERARYLAYLTDPATPQAARKLITQILELMDSIWSQYAIQKKAVLSGEEPAPLCIPKAWPTIWDVKQASGP